MLDKLQIWLKNKIGQPYAYIITCVLYISLTFLGLAIIGYFTDLLYQILLISILMSIIRFFTMGFHMNSNIKCFIMSSIVFIMLGIISKITPIWFIFVLCLYCCFDIYKKAPIELNDDFKNKDKEWHFKNVMLIMAIYLISSLILYYMNFYNICKCIMLSLIIVDILLFKNDKEYM